MALSSCLGDNLRARISGVALDARQGAYGRTFARTMTSGVAQSGWEQIEMEDMLDDDWEEPEEEQV